MSRVALCATREALDNDCPEAILARNGWLLAQTNAPVTCTVNDVMAPIPVNDVLALIT